MSNLLTHKMKSARTDHYGETLKLWWHCSEGSGNTITDRIAGVVATDNATLEWTVPHAAGITTAAPLVGSGIAGKSLPRQGMAILVVKPRVVIALVNVYLGAIAGTHINLTGNAVTIRTASGEIVSGLTGATSATQAVIAAVWDEDNLYTYYGADADATLVDTDSLPAAVKAAIPEMFPDALTFSENEMYGCALFDFSNSGVPADILTGINWMKDHWLAGDKVIYPEWARLT